MAGPKTREYDPAQVVFNVGGVDISGFAEGTFIESERNVDAFALVVGSDGENTRVKSANLSGKFKCTLQQSSPSNDYLSSVATQDEQAGNAAKPIVLKDANGTTLAKCEKGWVKKKAKSGFGNTAENREWEFETGNLVYDVGGENEL